MKLSDVDLVSTKTFVDGTHHDMFTLLRREAPVYWHDEPDGPGFWTLTKYDDVLFASRNHKIFSSWRGSCFLPDPPQEDLEQMRMMLVNMDPPTHTKLRRIVAEGFTPRMIRKMEEHVRELTHGILDEVAGRGECDLVEDIAAELPLQVICEIAGVPLEDRKMIFDWSNQLINFDDPDFSEGMIETGREKAAEMTLYANELAASRRKNPKDDLVSVLLHAEIDGQRLTDLEFGLFFVLLVVAGNETTRNAITSSTLALLEHRDAWKRLRGDPSLMPVATEEMLRWSSPVMFFRRTATEEVEIRGTTIREGDKVCLYYVSANRDEDVFPEPFRFDIERQPNDHLAFGLGAHYCLGNNLARLEIRILFEELLRRLPDIELNGPVHRFQSNFINGFRSVPIRYTPEASSRRASA